ncbi:hypothetical protein NDU88_008322 [Pleurodeles waltl]|uniref:Uncharacterized protein n=1 Tax=Pleurodeles waltl TaxID=8319 RepID=A0AAV7VS69_PLEWA|nr:hypothetical protein NDU88_008322 [Pleurodeles waltl]
MAVRPLTMAGLGGRLTFPAGGEGHLRACRGSSSGPYEVLDSGSLAPGETPFLQTRAAAGKSIKRTGPLVPGGRSPRHASPQGHF